MMEEIWKSIISHEALMAIPPIMFYNALITAIYERIDLICDYITKQNESSFRDIKKGIPLVDFLTPHGEYRFGRYSERFQSKYNYLQNIHHAIYEAIRDLHGAISVDSFAEPFIYKLSEMPDINETEDIKFNYLVVRKFYNVVNSMTGYRILTDGMPARRKYRKYEKWPNKEPIIIDVDEVCTHTIDANGVFYWAAGKNEDGGMSYWHEQIIEMKYIGDFGQNLDYYFHVFDVQKSDGWWVEVPGITDKNNMLIKQPAPTVEDEVPNHLRPKQFESVSARLYPYANFANKLKFYNPIKLPEEDNE